MEDDLVGIEETEDLGMEVHQPLGIKVREKVSLL